MGAIINYLDSQYKRDGYGMEPLEPFAALSTQAAVPFLRNHGAQLWYWITDAAVADSFNVAELARMLAAESGASIFGCYNAIRCVIRQVENEYRDNPNESPDDIPFTRKGNRYYWKRY